MRPRIAAGVPPKGVDGGGATTVMLTGIGVALAPPLSVAIAVRLVAAGRNVGPRQRVWCRHVGADERRAVIEADLRDSAVNVASRLRVSAIVAGAV